MPQPLATAPERAQLLANGEARAAGRAIDPVPVVRLFTPDAHVTWLLCYATPISALRARCRNTPGWPSAMARSRIEYGRL